MASKTEVLALSSDVLYSDVDFTYVLLLRTPSSGEHSVSAPPVTQKHWEPALGLRTPAELGRSLRAEGYVAVRLSSRRSLLAVTTVGLSPTSRRQLSGHTSEWLCGELKLIG